MTDISLKLLTPDGEPIRSAEVELRLFQASLAAESEGVLVPRLIYATTDDTGQLQVSLEPSASKYSMLAQDPESDAAAYFEFYVPQSDTVVSLEDLLLVPAPSQTPYDEAAIAYITQIHSESRATAQQLTDVIEEVQAVNAAATALNDQIVAATGDLETVANVVLPAANAASGHATAAEWSATAASNAAQTAVNAEQGATAQASTANTAAQTAVTKAAEANGSATSAAQSASDAAASSAIAVTANTEAQTARAEVAQSRLDVLASASDVEAARLASIAARDAASVSASAAAQDRADVAAIEQDVMAARTDVLAAETNVVSKEASAVSAATAASTSAADSLASKQAAELSAAQALTHRNEADTARAAAVVAKNAAEAAAATMTGALSEFGSVDLSGGAYPAKPITAGFWKVTVGGTVGSEEYGAGDTLVYSMNLDQFYKIDSTESVSSVNGKKGVVVLEKADLGLSQVDNTSDANKPVSLAQSQALELKQDKLPVGNTGDYYRGDGSLGVFGSSVRSTPLTGLDNGSDAVIVAADTFLGAMAKLQAQITGLGTSKLDAGANAVSATKLATARTIGGVAFDGTANINLPGVNAAGTQNTSGNAATATKLQNARTINGVSFDGTANITIVDATKEPAIAAGTPAQIWRGDKSWGTLSASDVPSLDASKVTTGTFDAARIPSGTDSSKLSLTGGTMTGNLTFSNAVMNIIHTDTDAGITRYIHSNDGSMGFLNSSGGWAAYSDNAGNWVATGNVTAYSDIRLKTDIKVIPNALQKVCALRGVTYKRTDSGERQTGLIAQEVQAVLPEAVNEGEHLSVAYGNLVGLLVEAIKELNDKLETK